MKFKIDENAPTGLKDLLAHFGHSAETIYDEGLVGEADDQLMKTCKRKGMVLVTLDKGFANIQTFPPGTHAGVITLRLHRQGARTILRAFKEFLNRVNLEDLKGCTVIVEEKRFRVRRPQK